MAGSENSDNSESDHRVFDLVVIGGGINGAAVARDAVGRGMRVALFERGDYAGQTSSSSSKLIHGGLRYLESYEFSLVSSSLKERDAMMSLAPHLVKPVRFLVPVYAHSQRPWWLLRLGLYLYDFLASSRKIARSGSLSKAEIEAIPHLRKCGLKAVMHYVDCQVDDARLVISTLLDARARGASINSHHEVTGIDPLPDGYRVTVQNDAGTREIDTRFVVNTAGPFANELLDRVSSSLPKKDLRLVRGSHLLFKMPDPALTTAFTLQNDDGRVIFVIPWQEGRFIMVGTTDALQEGNPADPDCSNEERNYLLAAFNRYFEYQGQAATIDDIVWSWAGVRPLVDDGADDPSKVTRSVRIIKTRQGKGGFITVYGGKLTTHRLLGLKVMKKLKSLGAKLGAPWTSKAPVTGGGLDRNALKELAENGPNILAPAIRHRMVFTYGDVAAKMFEDVASNPACAGEIAPGIPEIELRHARDFEDAITAEDFLYRRTKLFLTLDSKGVAAIEKWFSS